MIIKEGVAEILMDIVTEAVELADMRSGLPGGEFVFPQQVIAGSGEEGGVADAVGGVGMDEEIGIHLTMACAEVELMARSGHREIDDVCDLRDLLMIGFLIYEIAQGGIPDLIVAALADGAIGDHIAKDLGAQHSACNHEQKKCQ